MRIEKYIIAIAIIWFAFVIMVYGDFVSTDDIEEKQQVLMNSNHYTENKNDNKGNNKSNTTSNNKSDGENNEQMSDNSQEDGKQMENRENGNDSDYEGYPNKKYSWWFKRNKEHKQPEAQKEVNLGLYDAFYVDDAVKDTEENTKDTDKSLEDTEENTENAAENVRDQGEKKVIYLTFDCGYENGYTPKMLDVLKKHKAIATFFVTKPFIKDEPELVKRMKQEGHIVGNHTVHHPSMPEKSARENKIELIECAEYMKEATGYEMDKVMRPPRGEYSERTMRITKNMGYKTIFWSMAYVDYDVKNQPGADYVRQYYRDNHHNGAIPLIHNVSSSNAEALDDVLTFLEGEGYEFGSTLELGEKKESKKR